MQTKHIFNQERKRFEPKETKCIFCGLNHSRSMGENYFVPLFKEQDRTNVVVYRSVKYGKIPVGIPRCNDCLEIHNAASGTSKLYSWLAAIMISILAFFIWGIFGFFAIFLSLFIGIFGATYIEKKIVEKKGILTKLDGAKQDETVQNLVIDGWSFTQPSA